MKDRELLPYEISIPKYPVGGKYWMILEDEPQLCTIERCEIRIYRTYEHKIEIEIMYHIYGSVYAGPLSEEDVTKYCFKTKDELLDSFRD